MRPHHTTTESSLVYVASPVLTYRTLRYDAMTISPLRASRTSSRLSYKSMAGPRGET